MHDEDDDAFGAGPVDPFAPEIAELPTAQIIPFPRLRPDPKIAEAWSHERDETNARLQRAYRMRGPLDALVDLTRLRGMPQLAWPPGWEGLARRCVTYATQTIGIVGSSGSGKTSFLIQLLRANLAGGTPVLALPLELGQVDYNIRFVANMTGTHYVRIREEWPIDRIEHTLVPLADRLHYVDHIRDPIAQLEACRAAIRMAKKVYRRAPVLAVDYIGKMASGAGNDRRQILADAIESFREMAESEECFVILLSQTSRANTASLTGRADLEAATDSIGTAAETSEFEHACRVQIGLNVFKQDDAQSLASHVLVSKTNTGLEGRQGFTFHKSGGQWEELDHLPPTPAEERAKQRSMRTKDGVDGDQKEARAALNFERAARANELRAVAVKDALRRAGLFGMGLRDLRKVRGVGRAQNLQQTLDALAQAGDATKLDNGRWRIVPR